MLILIYIFFTLSLANIPVKNVSIQLLNEKYLGVNRDGELVFDSTRPFEWELQYKSTNFFQMKHSNEFLTFKNGKIALSSKGKPLLFELMMGILSFNYDNEWKPVEQDDKYPCLIKKFGSLDVYDFFNKQFSH